MEAMQGLKSALSKKDFENKFRPAYREMAYIEIKSGKKQGFWIFKTHVYGIDELLESEHFSKIDSIVEKIRDDVISWERKSQLSFFDKYIYTESRRKFDKDLHDLKAEICRRENTWFENLDKVLNIFIELVVNKLPQFSSLFLPFSALGMAFQLLSGKTEPLKLPPSTK